MALHRYLGQRLADYDYDKHFGGIFYLFLRGMEPTSERDTGIFRDRPLRELVCDLDAYLATGKLGTGW